MRRVALLLGAAMPLAAAGVTFTARELATDLAGGYQVVVEDVNRDGKPDLVALGSGMSELLWFENPTWERHVLATGMSRMINTASCSRDAEGFPVFVVAQGFQNVAARSTGEVMVLERAGAIGEPWRKRQIDAVPTAHRLRCADIDGSGKKVVIQAPLTAAEAVAPDYRGSVPLVYYTPGEWRRRLIGDQNEGVMHGVYIADWNGDGRDDVLTASFAGIDVYTFAGGQWTRSEIAKGDPAAWPASGSSDIAVGHLANRRFVASIEPWHGNQVAVYLAGGERRVIDDSLDDGHTILTADLDGDGRDEIIAGMRGGSRGVFVYEAAGEEWRRTALDDAIAAAACAVSDLNADGRPDIACIGSATRNLKVYENQGR